MHKVIAVETPCILLLYLVRYVGSLKRFITARSLKAAYVAAGEVVHREDNTKATIRFRQPCHLQFSTDRRRSITPHELSFLVVIAEVVQANIHSISDCR